MESRTYCKNLQITPRKLRVAADAARRLSPLQAIETLDGTNTKSARILAKVLRSAMANAKQTLNVPEDMVKFKLLVIEEGQKLRRFRASSRGMVRPFARQFAHAKIILTVPAPDKAEEPVQKKKEAVAQKDVAEKKEAQPKARTSKKTEVKKDAEPVKDAKKASTESSKKTPKKSSAKSEVSTTTK